MSDLVINLDTTALPPSLKRRPAEGAGSAKHRHFVRRRHFLERKGFLRQRQLPSQAPGPKREASRGRPPEDDKGGQKRLEGGGRGGPATASQAEGPSRRANGPPKENVRCGPRDAPAAAPSRALPASAKTAGASARPNGAPARGSPRDVSRVSGLLAEYESGLPSASAKPSKMVAIDCEMVGTGPGGRNSDLARCSVVGYDGDVIYDRYIRPLSPITNYRTRWSGIRRHHMAHAVPFKVAQKEVRGPQWGLHWGRFGGSLHTAFPSFESLTPPGTPCILCSWGWICVWVHRAPRGPLGCCFPGELRARPPPPVGETGPNVAGVTEQLRGGAWFPWEVLWEGPSWDSPPPDFFVGLLGCSCFFLWGRDGLPPPPGKRAERPRQSS